MVETYFIMCIRDKEKMFCYVRLDVIRLFLIFLFGYFDFISNSIRGSPKISIEKIFNKEGVDELLITR